MAPEQSVRALVQLELAQLVPELLEQELLEQELVRLELEQLVQAPPELELLALEPALQVLEQWVLVKQEPELQLMKEKEKLNRVKPLVQLELALWAPLELVPLVQQVQVQPAPLDRVQQLELQEQERFLRCNSKKENDNKGCDVVTPFFCLKH
ncbi:hypothetical protein GCM10011387_04330 [Pedobacter quisquiliarum]|uniref:Uncharacterized protein n=1 Tax=Pedobacter quisquiliarum TaxID=1834438 RepID=A0A916X971_9SPHI|nr:hypothetical protein GCM10011387_04330 [Pedobacter quisquiliarum]